MLSLCASGPGDKVCHEVHFSRSKLPLKLRDAPTLNGTMKKVVLRPVEGPQKPVELKIGKTIIGRGPLLECSDKKVSRNHAILEVTADGEVILTPTHVNPCFYQSQNRGPSRVMKKDKQHVLASGDSISLLPTSYKYIVEVINLSTTSPSSQVVDDVTKPVGESEEKDSLADKPATAAIPAEEAKKNGTAEGHLNSSTNKESVIKAENGERGSSKEASPEVCRKPATQTQQKKRAPSDESKTKPEGKRTLPKWLVESASQSASGTGKPKPTAQPRGKAASVRDEPAPKTKRTSVPDKEPVKKRGKPSAKASESESGKESKEEAKSEESGEDKSESEEEYKPKAREEKAVTGSRDSRGSRGGRSSRQNRSTMQKISLDDFVASDDDEWDNSAEEKKPRRRRKRAAAEEEEEDEEEESGSDWEEENCKTKRAPRRYVPSDSDSASDWERSSSRKKKPASRTRVQRKRRRRSSSDRESSEAESDDAPLKRPPRRTATKRESCKYGKKCFRKSGQHVRQFSHPGDSDYAGEVSDEEDDEEGDEEKEEVQNHAAEEGKKGKREQGKKEENDKGAGDEDNRPFCRYGADCFRKNALHLKNFKHPTPTKKAPGSQTPASKKGKPGSKAKAGSSDDEKASGDEYDWKDEDSENGGGGNATKGATKTSAKRKPRASVRLSATSD